MRLKIEWKSYLGDIEFTHVPILLLELTNILSRKAEKLFLNKMSIEDIKFPYKSDSVIHICLI